MRSDPALFPELARPVLALAEKIARDRAPIANYLLTEARDALDAFEKEAHRRGAAQAAVAPARYALLVILDTRARANRAMPVKAWSAGAMAALFRGRDTNLAGLLKIRDQGRNAGEEYADLNAFLDQCVEAIQQTRTHKPETKRSSGGRWFLTGVAVATCAAIGWGSWVEWSYRAKLLAVFPALESALANGQSGQISRFLSDLDRFEAAVQSVEAQANDSPLGLVHRISFVDPGREARNRYNAFVDALLPEYIADAVGVSLASEGSSIALYDTLRAWAILTGKAEWNPHFLVGWLQSRETLIPGLAMLAHHALALGGPSLALSAQDAELTAQALVFAAEAPENERAFLELVRSAKTANVANWVPAFAIPHIEIVLLRRTGLGLDIAIPGIFTAAGWDFAQSSGAAEAVKTTRDEAARLFATVPPEGQDTVALVLDVLQRETVLHWREFLSDIRVRPFDDQPTSVLISGTLGSASSPLTALLQAVWQQVGGNDRTRSFPNQLKIATEFGTTIQFVEQGKMADVSHLFASLNVALATLDANEEIGVQRLMNVQSRANSISTLRQAPPIVVQIVEDVLAQTSLSNEDLLKNQVNLLWQSQIFPICGPAMQSGYPFGDGPDMQPSEFVELIGPGGTLDRFFNLQLARLVDGSQDPWRWKPEARFSGFTPQSAEFFQRVAALRLAFFADDGSPDATLTMTALAERGSATVAIGGVSVPVVTSGTPESLSWPGPEPDRGIQITIETPAGAQTESAAGPWGLLHVLDGLRLRERDNGQRFLIDLHFADARLFVEMAFDSQENPVSGRSMLRGLTCPQSL